MAHVRKLALGSDHAGRAMCEAISAYLLGQGHQIQNVGASQANAAAIDYTDPALAVCRLLQGGVCELGILVCGTGLGMSIAANCLPNIRAALCVNEFMAKMGRAHNDANVLCLGERVIGFGTAISVVETFVSGEFAGGRHQERLNKLAQLREAP